MFHSKFIDNQTSGSREENFKRFLPYMGHGGHVRHVTKIIFINSCFVLEEVPY